MYIEFLVVLVSVFIFLFCFYVFARDDYVFIRKGTTMEQLFNIIFLEAIWGLFFSRLFYVLLHPEFVYLNPLVFFFAQSNPGLSVFGGLVGIFLTCIFLTKRRKIQPGRFTDYMSIAALAALPFWNFSKIILSGRSDYYLLFVPALYIVSFLVFIKIFFPKFIRSQLKEGSISLLFLMVFSLIHLAVSGASLYLKKIPFVIEDWLFVGLFVVALLLLVRSEMRKK